MGLAPGLPAPVDLADVWLGHALAYLLDACGVPESDRRELVESGIASTDAGIPAGAEPQDGAGRRKRHDASRLALVFAALAVEARLNRVLKRCDPNELRAVAHLVPAERFRLAPHLLGELDPPARHAECCDAAVALFEVRDELVNAGGQPSAPPAEASSRFGPSRARAMVEASAKICGYLATLTDEGESPTAERVRETADALFRWAYTHSVGRPVDSLHWSWCRDVDFPPDIVGS